jgi:hypothetical protein
MLIDRGAVMWTRGDLRRRVWLAPPWTRWQRPCRHVVSSVD